MLKLLVVDAAEDFRMALADALKGSYVVRTCGNGEEALELARAFAPELLILDLALPGVDGLSLVQMITQAGSRPMVLATTRFLSDYIQEAAGRIGIDYMMVKPCNIRAVAARLADLAASRLPRAQVRPDPEASVANVLLNLGIAASNKGYTYLRVAIVLYARDIRQAMTKELYPAVGKLCGASADQVERAMRTAIERAWNRRDEQIWRLYFTPDAHGIVRKPSNSELISRLADRLIRCRSSSEEEIMKKC